MGSVRYLLAAEMRRGGVGFVLLIALVLGVGGGLSLTAAAGARRATTAYDRFSAATLAADVLVAPQDGNDPRLTEDALGRSDGVVAAGHADGMVMIDAASGTPFPSTFLAPTSGAIGSTIDRPIVLEGRLPDPDDPTELFANPEGASAAGLRVGSRLELVAAPLEAIFELGEEEAMRRFELGELGERFSFRLVGIGQVASDVVPGAVLGNVLATPAFREQADQAVAFGATAVRLEPDYPLGRFIDATRDLSPGSTIDFQTRDSDAATIDRAIRPQTVALVVFALILGIGTLAAVAQAHVRRVAELSANDAALGAIGLPHRGRARVHGGRAALAGALGAALAIAVAIVGSRWMPIGAARAAEADRGIDLDLAILLPGAIVIAGASTLSGWLAATRRRRSGVHRDASPLDRLLGRAGSPAILVGSRFAFGSDGRGRASGARSTVVGAIAGLGVVVAALTFAAGLGHFVTTPRSYGWSFDALLATGDFSEDAEAPAWERLPDRLDEAPEVAGWSLAYIDQVRVAGDVIVAVGLEPGRGDVFPTIVSGRAPRDPDEVALGASTVRDANAPVGSTITTSTSSGPRRFRVVGTVVLPGLATQSASDQAGLGVGALFTDEGLMRATANPAMREQTTPSAALVRFDGPAAIGATDLEARMLRTDGEGSWEIARASRQSDVVSYARVRGTPVALAGLLALLAAITVGHGLVQSVGRRRGDLAVLRSMGASRGQVGRAVAWQGSIQAIAAIVVGVPLGLVLGRWSWALVAGQLGIPDVVPLPWVAIAFAAVGLLVSAIAIVWVTERRLDRVPPAETLRAE